MAIDDVARVALLHWTTSEALTMVAIAGCESGYRADARGDAVSAFPPERRPSLAPYACNGFTSFGPWQIHQPAHFDKLERATGSTDPCVWAEHLMDYPNNGRIAKEVWDNAFYGAWTCYNTGAYQNHMLEAITALDRVSGEDILGLRRPRFFLELTPVEPPQRGNPAFLEIPPVTPP